MSKISRREAGRRILMSSVAVVGAASVLRGAQWIDSVVRGVEIGAQSYSFRDRPLGMAIDAMRSIGLGECELWQGHVEPQHIPPEQLTFWRETVSLSDFHRVREQFDRAGIKLYAYNYSFDKDMNGAEFDRGFQMAKALGVRYITASSYISLVPKIQEYARKYKIVVAMHGHDNTSDPDEFSTAATFAKALAMSQHYIAVNLDIGHFVAAGGDPVAFIKKHHGRIVTLHIKDRKKNHGLNMPLGQGDTPIIAVLRLLRDNQWKIPANIEYEYGKPGMDTVAEVRKCYEYCRKALES
ncbi:MAG: sugar phosphate isomerase/epimerase family protein [Terriglobia bacterium]